MSDHVLTYHTPEETQMASQNHAITQLTMGAQLLALGEKYKPALELSLDMSTPGRQEILKKYELGETRELKPDLVLYNSAEFGFIKASKGRDKLRTLAVPLLCAEIVSPTQNSSEILDKFKVYFDIGVKSCWYIDPVLEKVHVYDKTMESETYQKGDLVDKVLDIRIPLEKVFC